MPANTILAVDTGVRTLLEQKKEFEKIGVLTLRAETMKEAIFLLEQGEIYKFVLINEDSIPGFMDSLKALCDAARTHVFITSHSYSKSKHTRAIHLGADAYVTYGETAKEDMDCALVHLDVPPKWIQRAARQAPSIVAGELVLYPTQRQLRIRDKSIRLQRLDYDILNYFFLNIDVSLSHEQIFQNVWGRECDENDHSLLWNHVYVLRREIKTATGGDEYIRTEKDYGYRFLPPYCGVKYGLEQLS